MIKKKKNNDIANWASNVLVYTRTFLVPLIGDIWFLIVGT